MSDHGDRRTAPPTDQVDHVCLYPYSTAGLARKWTNVTGMEAVLAREIGLRRGRPGLAPVTIVSDGASEDRPFELPDARVSVRPVAPELDPARRQAVLAVWFDELWSLLHPSAFTAPALSPELASVVYPEDPGDAEAPLASFERVVRHVTRRREARTSDPEAWFADRFEPELARIPARATVSWIEVFFTESIQRHAHRLRRSGSRQTLHCFLAHPESLHHTEIGRRILRAMSAMDCVFLQTDIYIRRLESQLSELGLPVPELRRFNHGPDSDALRRVARSAPPDQHVLGQLDDLQSALIADAVRTRGQVPHRFVCPDRLDPIKGIHVVIQAVDQLLRAQNASLETLRAKFRFYFVTSYLARFPPVDRSLAWHRYADWVRTQQIPQFMERWPGIVWFSDNIPDRALWTNVLVDCHVISGGIQEGLGLAVQEGLIVNVELGLGRTVVIGDGAGFAIQMKEQGLGSQSWFPPAGDVGAFAEALAQVDALPASEHLRRSADVVARFIEPHQDRILEEASPGFDPAT